MKRIILICLLCIACFPYKAQGFVSGADVSWCTEMENDGIVFYNNAHEETELFQLMKETGMTAVRLRVFVNPTAAYGTSWCDKADVLAKAKRAAAQGLDIMIDFHYSDKFADPDTQETPSDWTSYTREEVKTAVATHTKDVLQALKDEGITPKWVQVGNEINNGFIGDFGKIDWTTKSGTARFTNYVELSNAGYDAVKEICPDAQVIVHYDTPAKAQYFFDDSGKGFIAAGGKVDMIGLSHYPDDISTNATLQTNVETLISKTGKHVMICETGFSQASAVTAGEVMIDLFNKMKTVANCEGIFYWEPEVDGTWKPGYFTSEGWDAYGKGAFTTYGEPTIALDAFGGATEVRTAPSALKLFTTDGSTLLGTLLPSADDSNLYIGEFNNSKAWLEFVIVDKDSKTWYYSDSTDQTKLTTDDTAWKFYIKSGKTGICTITVDWAAQTWSYTEPVTYPATLSIYNKACNTVLATMNPTGTTGEYSCDLTLTEENMGFQIVDEESKTWYGCDSTDNTKLSSASGHWTLWIDGSKSGSTYTITADLVNMTWSYTEVINYPATLSIYNKACTTVLATLNSTGTTGEYSGTFETTEGWQNFFFKDEDNNTWYGYDGSVSTNLSKGSQDNLWIPYEATGAYTIKADLVNLTWSCTKPAPTELKIYNSAGNTVLATLPAVEGQDGVYSGSFVAGSEYLNFKIVDTLNNIWYGTDSTNTQLVIDSTTNMWFNNKETGTYTVTADLTTMTWSYVAPYPSQVSIYGSDGTTVLATMTADSSTPGVLTAKLDVTSTYLNFKIVDTVNNVWYGTDSTDTQMVADSQSNMWINSTLQGTWVITADFTTMTWSCKYHPKELKVYDVNKTTQIGTLTLQTQSSGAAAPARTSATVTASVYSGQITITSVPMYFYLQDSDTSTWYGTDSTNTPLIAESTTPFEISGEGVAAGQVYDVEANLDEMIWNGTYNEGATAIESLTIRNDAPETWYDLYGNPVTHPVNGQIYIVKKGTKVRKELYKG